MRHMTSAMLAAALGLAAMPLLAPRPAEAAVYVGVSVNFAPPPLPVYEQPPIPGPGYMWTPGYWAWDGDDEDYYWVPGTWVLAPEPGLLWTPAWWGWEDGAYLFHAGYWGPTVGFYGGINYGFGYTGLGYEGGYWNHDHFFYNRSVNNITNVNITNVYNKTVINNNVTRVSYNGGAGGVTARPTPAQMAAVRSYHAPPTPSQVRNQQVAARTPMLRAASNHGAPPVAATARPAVFNAPGQVTAARPAGAPAFGQRGGAPYTAQHTPAYQQGSPYHSSQTNYAYSARGGQPQEGYRQPAAPARNEAYGQYGERSAYAQQPVYRTQAQQRQAYAPSAPYHPAQQDYGYGYAARQSPQRQPDYGRPGFQQSAPVGEAYAGRSAYPPQGGYRPPAPAYAQRPPAEAYRPQASAQPRPAPRPEARPQGREDNRRPPER